MVINIHRGWNKFTVFLEHLTLGPLSRRLGQCLLYVLHKWTPAKHGVVAGSHAPFQS